MSKLINLIPAVGWSCFVVEPLRMFHLNPILGFSGMVQNQSLKIVKILKKKNLTITLLTLKSGDLVQTRLSILCKLPKKQT